MDTNGTNIQDKTITGEDLENEFLYFVVNTSIGNKKIFVASNMTDTQIESIKAAPDHNPEQLINNIGDITEDNSFLMTGQAVTEGSNSEIINIEEHKMDTNQSNFDSCHVQSIVDLHYKKRYRICKLDQR